MGIDWMTKGEIKPQVLAQLRFNPCNGCKTRGLD
jgi:hypothetical protein